MNNWVLVTGSRFLVSFHEYINYLLLFGGLMFQVCFANSLRSGQVCFVGVGLKTFSHFIIISLFLTNGIKRFACAKLLIIHYSLFISNSS